MKKSIVMLITLICMLGLLNCNQEGYLAKPVVDTITGTDYSFKLITKDHYTISCPNPEKFGYKEIYYDSKVGLKKNK